MTEIVALVVLGAGIGWLWWSGALDGLGDRVREATAVLRPARPLSRRALPRRLLRAATRTVSVGVSGTALLPSRIEIAVNPADVEPFAEALDWLGHDVAEALRKLAPTKGWMVPDGPRVVVVPDPERPLRMPRATGRIGALSPDHVRTLERPAGGDLAGGVPPDYTGSAETVAEALPVRPDHGRDGGRDAGTRRPVPSRTAGRGPDRPAQPDRADQADRTDRAPAARHTAPTVPVELGTLHLRLVSGQAADDLSAVLTPAQAPLVLGRSRQCDLRVRDRHASARHCAFSVDAEGRLTVEDLQSTNGTFVDGRRVRRATLQPGAVLRAGDSSWRVALDGITTDSGS